MQQTRTKGVQDEAQLDGKVDPPELYKRLKFHHFDKWYIHKPESVLENET